MKSHTKKFKEYLAENGLKFTPERKTVLRTVFSSHTHFDIETLYERLHNKGENISRATIYRTLPLLVESGLVRETLRCQDKVSYEHIFGHEHHDHMICIKCGKVIEFKDNRIKKLRNSISSKNNFQPEEHRFGIRGYCEKCRRKEKSK